MFIAQSVQGNPTVSVTRNIDYLPSDNYSHRKDFLDIYAPAANTGLPVVVYFHGGALLRGDKSLAANFGIQLAENGVVVVAANYRLSPEVQFPAHVDDVAAATRWVLSNIQDYSGEPRKVFVVGHSAGGYLAALLAIDESITTEGDEALKNQLQGAVLISPFLFVEQTAKDRIEKDPIHRSIWGDSEEGWRQASVTPHLTSGRHNIAMIYADGDEDWRKEQNERFAAMLKKQGNTGISTTEVPNRDHSSLLTDITKDDDQIIDFVSKFVSEK